MSSVSIRSILLVCSTLFVTSLQAAAPLISYVSGVGPHPLGTTLVDIEVATDVNSNCRLNDVDTGNPGQWSTLLTTSNNLNHTSQITVANDEDTSRYIRCRNVSTGEVNASSFTFNITFVANNNTPPTIDSTGILNATEDSLYTYNVIASDAEDSSTLDYSLIDPPGTMTIDEDTGLISWTPVNEDVGDKLINIQVTDAGGLIASDSYTLTVANVNDTPVINSTPITTANENSPYIYDVDATDPDTNDELKYELEVSPTDMAIDEVSGLITWTPTNAQIGDQAVVVLITDLQGVSIQHSFTITVSEVNVAPEFSSTHELTAIEGVLYDYDVGATDDNTSDVLSYGLINPPTDMTIDSASGLIDWTPTNAQVGAQDVIVTVSDLGGLSTEDTFTIIVSNVNGAPSFTSVEITTATENQQYSYDAEAEDDDVGDSLTYSLFVSPSNDMSIDDVSGLIAWTPTTSDIGTHDITIHATDLDGLFVDQSFEITVSAEINDVGPVRTYVSGAGPHPLGTTLVTIEITTDVDATCRLNNVDDNNPIGWTTALDTTNDTTHTSPITLVNDEDTTRYIICRDTSSNVVNGIAFVFDITFEEEVNQAPSFTNSGITTATEGVAYIYDADATDPDGDDLTFSANPKPASMTVNSESGLLNWTPTTDDVGTHDVTLTVSDLDGLSETQTFTITVEAANQAPSFTNSGITTATEGVAYIYDADATDPDSDDLTFSANPKPTLMTVNSESGLLSWTPTSDDIGTHNVTLTVSDPDGLSEIQIFTITVEAAQIPNQAPSFSTEANTDAISGSSYSYDADATDPDGDDLTFSANPKPELMTVDSESGLLTWEPTTSDVGTHDVTLTVFDPDGLSDSQTFIIDVLGVVTVPNLPPRFLTTEITTATVDVEYYYDADGDGPELDEVVTFSADPKPADMTVDPLTGEVRWTPTSADVGEHDVTLTVTDPEGYFSNQTFVITVESTNQAPSFTSTEITTATENVEYVYDVNATDPDTNDSLTYTLPIYPTGMTIDNVTGIIKWTPTNAQVGTQNVSVTVTDLAGLSVSQIFDITVTNANGAHAKMSKDPIGFYYSAAFDTRMSNYEKLVVNAEAFTAEQINDLASQGTELIAYITVGESDELLIGNGLGPDGYASWYYDQDDDGLVDKNGNWESYYVNTADPEWKAHIFTKIDELAAMGVSGLFLDTVDTVDLYPESTDGMVDLIQSMHEKVNSAEFIEANGKNLIIVQNRGFTVMDRTAPYINAILFESFTGSYQWEPFGYVINDNYWDAEMGNNLVDLRLDNTHLEIWSLDYVEESDTESLGEILKNAVEHGFKVTTSDVFLTRLDEINLNSASSPALDSVEFSITPDLTKPTIEINIDPDIDLTAPNNNIQIFIHNPNGSILYDDAGVKANFMIDGGLLHEYVGTGITWDWIVVESLLNIVETADSYIVEIPNSERFGITSENYIETFSRVLDESWDIVLEDVAVANITSQFKETLLDWTINKIQIFIDNPNENTAYNVENITANFLIEDASLYEYTGDGTSWEWEVIASDLPFFESDDNYFIELNNPEFFGITSETHIKTQSQILDENWDALELVVAENIVTKFNGSSLTLFAIEDKLDDLVFTLDVDNKIDLNNHLVETFIDTHSNNTTYTNGAISADYLISNGVLYQYSGTGVDWTWSIISESISETKTIGTYSFNLPRDNVELGDNHFLESVIMVHGDGTIDDDMSKVVRFVTRGRDNSFDNGLPGSLNIVDLEAEDIDTTLLISLTIKEAPLSTYHYTIFLGSNDAVGYAYYDINATHMLKDDELFQYEGTGEDWNWTLVKSLTNLAPTENTIQYDVEMTDLNLSNGSSYSMIAITEDESWNTIDVSATFSAFVDQGFQIIETDYLVYEAANGTLYLVSQTTSDVFKVVKVNGVDVILISSIDELNDSGAVLLSGYITEFRDQNLNGTLDLILIAPADGSLNNIVIDDFNGDSHLVLVGNLVADAPAIHIEPIPDIDLDSQQVGTIQGAFRVDEGGGATYTVPLSLPVGTAGVSPELALSYSSNAGNGILGKGWWLSGLSAVTRCKVTQETDGADTAMVGVKYLDSDRFCLGGSRLVVVDGDAYGADGARYSTEINSTQRIISHGVAGNGPSYFTVESKDGVTRSFGNTDNSKLFSNSNDIATTTIALWALNQSIDRNGNYINYIYETEQDNGVQRISEIAYTGNADIQPYNFVYFDYENRDDERQVYVAGSKFKTDKRLYKIRIETPEPTTNVSTLVKRYEFAFELSGTTNESLLNSITECSGSSDDTCILPTTFDWEHGENQFEAIPQFTMPQLSPELISMDPLDFNGDGNMDLAFLTHKGEGYNLWSSLVTDTNIQFVGFGWDLPFGELDYIFSQAGDIDGDGNMDYLAPRWVATGEYSYYVFKGAENGLSPWFDTGELYDTQSEQKDITLADINGDGLADILKFNSTLSIGVRLNSGGAFDDEESRQIITTGDSSSPNIYIVDGIVSVQDHDGDGIMDVVFKARRCVPDPPRPFNCTTEGTIIGLSRLDENDEISFNVSSSTFKLSTLEFKYTDINGDGAIDRLFENTIEINKGDGTYESITLDSSLANFDRSQTVDFNGDGLMDLIYPSTVVLGVSTWQVALSNGVNYDQAFDSLLNAPLEDAVTKELFSDYNGDGILDYFEFERGVDVELTLGKSQEAPRNVITKFTNGFGEYQEVKYKPLTDPTVYTKGTGANQLNYGNGSPIFDIISPSYLVSEAIGSQPNYEDDNATVSVTYFYENARAQAGGRGFLGFEKVYSTDEENGIVTATKYRQDFPYAGQPVETVVGYSKSAVDDYLESDTQVNVISATSTDWALHQVSNGFTDFPFLETSTHIQFLGGIPQTSITTQTVDDYNNVLTVDEQIHETRDDIEYFTQQKITTNEYQDDNVDSWLLGRLTETMVEVSRPDQDLSEVTPVTRNSSFHYNVNTGQLEYETINSNDVDKKLKLTTAYQYDLLGNIIRTTQCSGHIVSSNCGVSVEQEEDNPYFINRYNRNVWDSLGRFVDVTYNGLEQRITEVISRHITGAPTQIINLGSVTVDKLYDAHGRQQFERSSTGSWVSTAIRLKTDDLGNPLGYKEITSGGGIPTSVKHYDIMGRETHTQVTAFDGYSNIYKSINYDKRGRVNFESTPNFSLINSVGNSYTYDVFNRVTNTSHPDGVSSIDYSNPSAITFTNQINQTKTEERNVLGELLGSYENGNANLKTTYGYNSSGKILRTTDVDSIDTSILTYNVLGQKATMNDVDSGSWIYSYNSLGQLVSQTDAKGQVTEFLYDQLGRKVSRVETGDYSTETLWHFDNFLEKTYPGKLIAEEIVTSGYSKVYGYDSLGRLNSTSTHIPGNSQVEAKDYTESTTFDEFGRVFQQFDISGNQAGQQFVYSSNGYLTTVKDTRHADNYFFYHVNEMNAFGKITSIEMGNGVVSDRKYNLTTGLLEKIQTGEGFSVQDLEYGFNEIGRLERRHSTTLDGGLLIEEFGYDDLNRLETAAVLNSSLPIMTLTYENNGNILSKSDVSSSSYDYLNNHSSCSSSSSSPHAVKQIGIKAYCYDANGNRTSTLENGTETRSVVYSNFNKPLSIENKTNNHTTSFSYGTTRQRFAREDINDSGIKTTHYIGNVEIHYKINGDVEYKRNVGGHAQVTASGENNDIKYLHKDYQGSITAITDQNVEVVQRMSFDAFGKRRTAVTWDEMLESQRFTFDHEIITRGYTGHEMLDEVGIIHMNGRTYDAEIGRFMQADPVVQDPGNGQNLNRYTYVLNSPMSYTDPSGYFYYRVPPNAPRSNPFVPLLQVAAAVFTAGQSLWIQAAASAAVGYVATGTFRGAAIGAFTAVMFNYMGTALKAAKAGTGVQALVRGIAGGVSSVLQGGKFGHGFVSSAAVSLAHRAIADGLDSAQTQTIAAGIVGGTISAASGGKFSNGAVTSAFMWAFNYASHNKGKAPATNSNPTITGSDKVAFVGGAMDKTSAKVVLRKFNAYIKANGVDSAEYFEWTDADLLSTYVADNNGRVTIVAHSYGADEAAHLIANGMQVYKFVSVDPVGWTRPSMQAIANNTVIWNNFESTASMFNSFNDFIATIGGSWGSLPSSNATNGSVSSAEDHVTICKTYCNP